MRVWGIPLETEETESDCVFKAYKVCGSNRGKSMSRLHARFSDRRLRKELEWPAGRGRDFLNSRVTSTPDRRKYFYKERPIDGHDAATERRSGRTIIVS